MNIPHWREVKTLCKELEESPIDLLYIDGKHVDNGQYQDFISFFPFVRSGGLILCNDLHDESFPYDWAGHTLI